MDIRCDNGILSVVSRVGELLSHSSEAPMLFIGRGEPSIDMYRGNFKIEDYVESRIPLRRFSAEKTETGVALTFEDMLRVTIDSEEDDTLELAFTALDPQINRLWLRVSAEKDEHCYGCGEQMSYFDLRGRHFPLWTSEPGVGRDKTTYVTWRSDVENKAGGDYYNTNFPAPLYVSSRRYWLWADCTAYADFDFRHECFHELQFWAVPRRVRIRTGESLLALVSDLGAFFGRQPTLPDWIYNGAILGLQGGTERVSELVERSQKLGVAVSGVWCQDWEGKRVTSFGKRLQWDWHWNESMYPGLPERIEAYEKEGIRFLGYINPYLVNDGLLFREGAEKGYFALDDKGEIYLVDFGEFYCGVVDFTNPDAFAWFKEIIKKNLIDFGLRGWMADFGEYLPIDVRLYDGTDPMLAHNAWPVEWARCNYEALKECGLLGEALVFMRAGGVGTQKYCPLLWAGDQSVDFSVHDGLISVVSGTLSAAMCGCGLNHSDIGGYTSLFGNCRTKELFLRWAEMAAFSPVMRTHEGNRPDENFQYYDDEDCIVRFGRLTRIYAALAPYLRKAVKENSETGIGVQRPLLLHYEGDPRCMTEQTEYLLGRDVLVAPVYEEGAQTRTLYLPADEWIHLWSGKRCGGGEITVDAPLGYPAVFYRADAPDAALFAAIAEKF
ncbi:MAG: alpha-glucosidase [Oscillospiraceae bacterium]|nr:alpha-glucosidase [Oscillospiraceae bacterium]